MEKDINTEVSNTQLPATEEKANLKESLRDRYDYGEFLRKFAVMGEEMHINDDEFDYIYYTYGLELYENMPLIEPQETKEVKKVAEFVIVIDTSMSCSQNLVRKFLEETYGILCEEDSFLKRPTFISCSVMRLCSPTKRSQAKKN